MPAQGNVAWTQYTYQQLSLDVLAEFPQTGPPRVNYLYRGRAGAIVTMEEQQGGGAGKEYWFAQDGLGNTAAVTKQDGQMEEIMLAIYIYDIYIDLKMLHNDSRNILQDIQLIIDRMVLDISVPRAKTNLLINSHNEAKVDVSTLLAAFQDTYYPVNSRSGETFKDIVQMTWGEKTVTTGGNFAHPIIEVCIELQRQFEDVQDILLSIREDSYDEVVSSINLCLKNVGHHLRHISEFCLRLKQLPMTEDITLVWSNKAYPAPSYMP